MSNFALPSTRTEGKVGRGQVCYNPDVTYEESVQYMSGLRAYGQRTDRARFTALLARLGNPHQALRSIHVAGTNGKGSTTTFIASVLREAGYTVGAYLSPYVFDVRERVQVNGALISRDDFSRHVAAIHPHIEALAQTEHGQTPEFELKTAIAFRHFAEVGVDYAVIEVGIGGRLDATNVIPPPLVAIITNIGWDHVNLLGNTLGSIAFEKAGIFKTGTIGVTAEQEEEPLSVIRQVAQERSIPLNRVCPTNTPDADAALVTYERDPAGNLHLRLSSGPLPPLRLALRGAYQSTNAATAAAAVEVLRRERGLQISNQALMTGLGRATLPGRFQLLRPETNGPTLVLDGAHNADGAHILAEALRAEFGTKKRYTFVIGTSRNHAPGPYLEVLAPLAERVIATAPAFKPTPAHETASAAADLGLPVITIEPASQAIQQAFAKASAEEVIVVTGSFYVVGETPKLLRGEQ